MRWNPELDAQREQNRMVAIVGMQTERISQVDPLLGAALINFSTVSIANWNQSKVVVFADDSKIVADLFQTFLAVLLGVTLDRRGRSIRKIYQAPHFGIAWRHLTSQIVHYMRFPLSSFIDWILFVMHTQSTYCVCLCPVPLSFTSQTDVDYDPFVEPYHSWLLTSLCTCSTNRNAIICSKAFTFIFLTALSRLQSQTVFIILLLFGTQEPSFLITAVTQNVFFSPWLLHQQCPAIIHRSLNFHTVVCKSNSRRPVSFGLTFRHGTSRPDLLHRQQYFTQV